MTFDEDHHDKLFQWMNYYVLQSLHSCCLVTYPWLDWIIHCCLRKVLIHHYALNCNRVSGVAYMLTTESVAAVFIAGPPPWLRLCLVARFG